MKKALSLLTVSAMAVSMLAGCGSSTPAETTAAATQAAATEAAATEAAAAETTAAAEAATQAAAEAGTADLESLGFAPENITIVDGANDQATQTNQIQNFITEGVDVLIINPVNSSSAATITDMVTAANIPLVYINREPDAQEEERWATDNMNVTYVGCDARQSGTMQGEIVADLENKGDINGDGKVSYIMIEGDPENVDAQYRTEFSVKALTDAGITVEELDDQVGNWDQAQAQSLVANSLAQHGKDIEVVFCNNDAMALGALQAIEAAGETVGTDVYLLGVDALQEACENVKAGKQTGTVFNDHISQSHSAADAAVRYITGEGNDHYIGCDYVKVTTDNVDDILASLG